MLCQAVRVQLLTKWRHAAARTRPRHQYPQIGRPLLKLRETRMVSVGVGVQPITDLFQASRRWSRFPAMPDSEFVGEAASPVSGFVVRWSRCMAGSHALRSNRKAGKGLCRAVSPVPPCSDAGWWQPHFFRQKPEREGTPCFRTDSANAVPGCLSLCQGVACRGRRLDQFLPRHRRTGRSRRW